MDLNGDREGPIRTDSIFSLASNADFARSDSWSWAVARRYRHSTIPALRSCRRGLQINNPGREGTPEFQQPLEFGLTGAVCAPAVLWSSWSRERIVFSWRGPVLAVPSGLGSTPFGGCNSKTCSGRQANRISFRHAPRSSRNRNPASHRDGAHDHIEPRDPCNSTGRR